MPDLPVTPMDLIVSLLLGGGLFALVWSIFRTAPPPEPAVHRRTARDLGVDVRDTVFEHPALASGMAVALQIARRFNFAPVRRRVRRDLDASGNPEGYTVDEYLAICLATAVVVGLASGLLALLLLGQFDPLVVLLMSGVGLAIPVWVLHESAQRRVRHISRQLPFTLDLISLTMASGSSFTEAVETIVRDEPEAELNQELALVRAEVELGSTRAAALANLAERIPLDALRSVVGAVNQAESLGTPLSEILRNQAMMMRMHRSVRAEKLSASASLRILIPSVLILMAVIIVLFGPMLLRWFRGEGILG